MRNLLMLLALAAPPLALLAAPLTARADEAPERYTDQAADLIGGEPAKPEDWPASVYARAGGAACSSTVVGERVVLIAAHCVSDGKSIEFAFGPQKYTAKCTHSPDYRRDTTADWALCLTDRKVDGVLPELVAQDGSWCAKGVKVRLTGYGCTRVGGTGGNDGVYRIGEAEVTSCPSRDNDTVTKGGAALCYGDSGGPAFREYDDGSREVFAVNSRGDIRTTSYLASVFTAKAKSFFTSWQEKNGAWICGYPGSGPCRGSVVPPPPPPPPAGDCKEQLAVYEQTLSLSAAKYQALKACVNGAAQ